MKPIKSIKNINDLNEAVAENKKISTAVKLKCLDCSAYEWNEVRNCHINDCPLHPFRDGHNPFAKKRELTEEQLAALSDRAKRNFQKSNVEE